MITTKILRNTSKEDMFIPGIGDIPAGEQVSITTEYHTPVVLENYPGLVDATDEEVAPEADVTPEEPVDEAS